MKIHQHGAHLDQMMRQTRQHHVQLSAMADHKANMVLTIASIVLTLTVPRLHSADVRLADVVLVGFCLVTMGLAAYVVMPKVPFISKSQAQDNASNPTFNLLFFGDFAHLDYPEYERRMETLMNDPNEVYAAQVREVYALGCFLAKKKYRFLRLAYLAFFTGLAASAIIMLLTGGVF